MCAIIDADAIECTIMDASTDAVVDADVSIGADVECKYEMRIWV